MQGLILLDKPQGMTSFSAVSVVRRLCGEKRAGHTGTLDPMATGVLPILLGRATRLSDLMLDSDKRYTAELLLGVVTDTLDITGTVLNQLPVRVNGQDFEAAVSKFRGEIMQTPPMYSAIQRNGVRLYDLARKGIEVERESRKIVIKELTVIEQTAPDRFVIDVLCSKGTYIRSLADDIGKALGCGAVLSSLRRTLSAGYSIDDCTPLSQLKESGAERYLQNAERAVEYLDSVTVTAAQAVRFLNGGALSLERLTIEFPITNNALIRVHGPDGEFLGLGCIRTDAAELTIKCIVAGGDCN